MVKLKSFFLACMFAWAGSCSFATDLTLVKPLPKDKSKSTAKTTVLKQAPHLLKEQPSADEDVPQVRYRYHLGGPLKGGIEVNVPKTPDEVASYLRKMRRIIQSYTTTAVATLMPNGGSPRLDMATMESGRSQTIDMIAQIRAIVPPADLKDKHNQLAATLAEVNDLMVNPPVGGGMEALGTVGPLISKVFNTFESYHTGVTACIAYYGLSPSLDPFFGENEEAKANALQGIDQAKSRAAQTPGISGLSGLGALGGDGQMDGQQLGDLLKALGGLSGSSGQALPDLGSEGGAAQGQQNPDINSLLKQLGGGDAKDLNQLLGQ